MMVVYECEKLVILQDNEKFIIHVLDNYRLVKEIVTNRNNLISTLESEFSDTVFKKGFFFGGKLKKFVTESIDIEKILRFV